jgi:hypothetical protein
LAATDSCPTGAERKVVHPMTRVDPDLVKAVREGTYVVDPYLIADAIVRRHERRAEAERLASVLEAGQRNGGSIGRPEDDAGPRTDVA